MSDYESHSGTIYRVPFIEGETELSDIRQRLWKEGGYKSEDYDHEAFESEFSGRIFEINGALWEISDHEEHEHGDSIVRLYKFGEDQYHFYTHFYNGGTCLGEMLEDGINDQKA